MAVIHASIIIVRVVHIENCVNNMHCDAVVQRFLLLHFIVNVVSVWEESAKRD